MSEESKPCPFCGGELMVADATKILGVWNAVHRCPVMGPITLSAGSRPKIIEKWNTRYSNGGSVVV